MAKRTATKRKATKRKTAKRAAAKPAADQQLPAIDPFDTVPVLESAPAAGEFSLHDLFQQQTMDMLDRSDLRRGAEAEHPGGDELPVLRRQRALVHDEAEAEEIALPRAADRDHQVAVGIDLAGVARQQHRGRGMLLDQRRPLDPVAGDQRGAPVGRRGAEAAADIHCAACR